MKRRLLWVDVAKGILIAEVVLWHQANQFLRFEPSPGTMQACRALQTILMPFFMQAFFFLTGFCTDFRKPPARFVADKARTLLFPAAVFAVVRSAIHAELDAGRIVDILQLNVGPGWFLRSLFLSLLAVRALVALPSARLFALACAALPLFGLVCGIRLPAEWNVLHWEQALAMSAFVLAGLAARRTGFAENPARFLRLWPAALGWLLATGWMLSAGVKAPWFGKFFRLLPTQIPAVLAMAAGGTVAVTALSILLVGSFSASIRPLAALGRASLVVYLVHNEFILLFLNLSSDPVVAPPFRWSAVFLSTLLCSLLVTRLCETKWTRWVLGRFAFHRPAAT